MVASLQHDASAAKLKVLELERAVSSLAIADIEHHLTLVPRTVIWR